MIKCSILNVDGYLLDEYLMDDIRRALMSFKHDFKNLHKELKDYDNLDGVIEAKIDDVSLEYDCFVEIKSKIYIRLNITDELLFWDIMSKIGEYFKVFLKGDIKRTKKDEPKGLYCEDYFYCRKMCEN